MAAEFLNAGPAQQRIGPWFFFPPPPAYSYVTKTSREENLCLFDRISLFVSVCLYVLSCSFHGFLFFCFNQQMSDAYLIFLSSLLKAKITTKLSQVPSKKCRGQCLTLSVLQMFLKGTFIWLVQVSSAF